MNWRAIQVGGLGLAALLLGCKSLEAPSAEADRSDPQVPGVIAQLTHRTVPIQTLAQIGPDSTVYVEGTVLLQAPLLESSLYQLGDETGKVWVRSSEPLPALGEPLRIRGVVRSEQIVVEGIDISELYLQERSRSPLDDATDNPSPVN